VLEVETGDYCVSSLNPPVSVISNDSFALAAARTGSLLWACIVHGQSDIAKHIGIEGGVDG
jgi:hypothetical protein